MKIELFKIIAGLIAAVFSLLTIIEGSKVLFGNTVQDYTVFIPLLIYNVIMGIIGLFVGVSILIYHIKSFAATKIVLIIHSIVLIIIIGLYLASNLTALHSVQAMIVRVSVWIVIFLLVWKSTNSKKHNKNNVDQINDGYSDEK